MVERISAERLLFAYELSSRLDAAAATCAQLRRALSGAETWLRVIVERSAPDQTDRAEMLATLDEWRRLAGKLD